MNEEVEDNPTVLRDEIVNCFALPPLPLCKSSDESFIS